MRRVRVAACGVTGALLASIVMAPSGAAVADGDDAPVFSSISAEAVQSVSTASTPDAARRSSPAVSPESAGARRAATSKGTQILQVWKGIQGAGQQGVSIAAGPSQVVQTVSDSSQGVVRAFVKSTGVRPKGASKTLLQFFGLSNPTTVSQASVIYDPVGKRFVVVAVADNDGDIGLVMRISKGTAATPLSKKKWLKPVEFAFSTSTDEEPGRRDVDESKPLIGVTSDKIVVTAEATDPSDATVANRIFLFPKKEYYGGNDSLGAWAASVDATYDGQAPALNATKQANAFIAVPSDNVIPVPDNPGEIAVTTYTGAANTSTPPQFSQSLLFPEDPLVAPPTIAQPGGDTLDLGGLAFSGVVWRSNTLYAATTVAAGGSAAVRVFGMRTNSGVSLKWEKTLKSSGVDWFSPDLSVDRGSNVLLTANDIGSAAGPSLAVFARKGSKWLSPLFVAKGNAVTDTGSSDWWNSTGAAWDPTSPWDVWIAGVVGNGGVGNGLSTSVGRVSLTKNKATIKASTKRVRKGNKVTFTVKLVRPDSKNTIRGLPVALQRAPRSGGSFSTIKSGTTAANGTARWKVKVSKATRYRTLGKVVKQQNGAGRTVAKVTSRPVTITLR